MLIAPLHSASGTHPSRSHSDSAPGNDISRLLGSSTDLRRQQRVAAGEPVGLGGSIVTALFGGRPTTSANSAPASS